MKLNSPLNMLSDEVHYAWEYLQMDFSVDWLKIDFTMEHNGVIYRQ